MKRIIQNIAYSLLLTGFAPIAVHAQTLQGRIPNLRPYDQSGINSFETKKDTAAFDGAKIRIGAGFTQEFQGLKDQNYMGKSGSNNGLYKLSPGFNQGHGQPLYRLPPGRRYTP
ncbi:hypothetical protein ACQ86N_25400 [Puia sp. P3]|uniref:hypothetical protein n=1 Tax=Puia sp. P3 TaxID=3423952 RepID=UPI003D67C81A